MVTKVAENIVKSLGQIRQEIDEITAQSRFNETVRLLAVSKKHPVEAIRAAYEAGQREFAENYVQEGVDKVEQLNDLDLVWHFIGPLQSNKTKLVAEHFDWVQSIEREKIARRLNEQRPENLAPLNVLLQVNIDNDPNKSGVQKHDVNALAEFVSQCSHLKLRGIMTILEADTNENQQLNSFAAMRSLYEQLQQMHPSVDTLSMGMSGDMRQAILAGANMVRIGSAIFGQRE
ncbi:YggS family pyridoxal phosphate-dependent enzyme [Idiomarina fontislapidosi]|uniref:Pyridoxal phosphate homeostasis protein n=1 Tax=Idiomarina fontislapidosi TaxID=263723 RepID=A0A432XV29_9GAMM|nr:YggS family pyridoxal phosphate-dependent enzyme [Idiomarina fontislapidosi]RUO52586.1 YggS family pyridoxal phosphate-dependent enzyme [Idiomarina fontislapidosi]